MNGLGITRDSCKRMAALASSLILAVGAATTASAAHHFVSESGTWTVPDLEGDCYGDLQTALNAVRAGDTVWLQDGFVCASGQTASISGRGYARVKLPNLAFTLRSESGYVDESAGKGAYIRGEKDPDSAYEDGHGDNAIRPVWAQYKLSVIQGLVLEGGSTGDAHNYGCGGGVYGAATISNCVIRNVSAYCGGAFGDSGCVAYNTVISNCYAFGAGYGGGAIFDGPSLYDCQVVNNSALKKGGAVYYNNNGAEKNTVYSNCVFRGNVAIIGGAINLEKSDANTKRVRMIDCRIVDNKSTNGGNGGVAGAATMIRCTIAGNQTHASTSNQSNGGGVGATAYTAPQSAWPVLVDCVVSNNHVESYGAGLYCGFATNCLFIGNWSCGDGGGAYMSQLYQCRFIDNSASNNFNSVNSAWGNGGGCAGSVATRCLFAGNKAWAQNLVASGNGGAVANSDLYNCVVSNNWAKYRGAAVYNAIHGAGINPFNTTGPYRCYNTLIVGNASDAPHVGYDRGMIIEGESGNTLSATPPEFYNCTIAGNSAANYAIVNDAMLYNCVVWGNTAPGGEFFNAGSAAKPNYQVWAQYTCQAGLEAGVDGNTNRDPGLAAGCRLGTQRPCVNAARAYDWMTAEGDVRSRDLDGNPRVLNGAPDMGAYERELVGAMIYVR